MTDTPIEVTRLFEARLSRLGAAQRLGMACRMYAGAMELVRAGIRVRLGPQVDEVSERTERFLRVYGEDFTAAQRRRILAALRGRPVAQPNGRFRAKG